MLAAIVTNVQPVWSVMRRQC